MKIVVEYESLLAVRDAARALASSIDAALRMEHATQGCLHPSSLRLNVGTMGNPGAWVCKGCNAKGHDDVGS